MTNSQTIDTGSIQKIALNQRVMQSEVGQRLSFNLPGSGSFTFSVDSIKEGYQGSKTISATSDNGLHLLLTMDDKAAFGNIDGNGLSFSISHEPALGQILIDQTKQPAPEVDLSNDGLIPPWWPCCHFKTVTVPQVLPGSTVVELVLHIPLRRCLQDVVIQYSLTK